MATEGVRVLLVDEDQSILEKTKFFLERSGDFDVDIATTAVQAIQLAQKNPYDAILSNYLMPLVNTVEFFKLIRARDPDIPFLLFSGKDRETIIMETLNKVPKYRFGAGSGPKTQFAEYVYKVQRAVKHKMEEDLIIAQRDLGIALAAASSLEEAIPKCIETAIRVSDTDCGGLFLLDEDTGYFNLVWSQGLSKDFILDTSNWRPGKEMKSLIMTGTAYYSFYPEIRTALFSRPPDEGLRAIALVPILEQDRTIGCFVMGSHSLKELPLSSRTRLETLAAQTGNAIARIQAEVEIQASLDEKVVLLQEVHHRVKNNLQIISGLLKMQEGSIKDETALNYIRDAENRIISMALVHESLDQSKDFSSVNAEKHLKNIAQQIIVNYSTSTTIHLEIDAKDAFLDLSEAIPCSLIINELITNSIKYAFVGRERGIIRITMHPTADNRYLFTVSDDGIGFPEDKDFRATSSLGMKLVVNLMTIQLKGTIELERENGTRFIMSFPKKNN
jgi:two-component sensor histidine kinase/CheY-like chemotaxis protein